MCLVLIGIEKHPDYRLIFAGNRDEFYERPTARASFWKEAPELLAGRDLRAGGTWFGITRNGRIGAITNFSRRNLPQDSWGAAISLFTIVFAVSQTLGPVGAGLIGDRAGSIGASLLVASGVLLTGAVCAALQRPLTRA